MKASWGFAIGFLMMLPLFYMDCGGPEYPELQKAERAVRYISAKRQLKRSSFAALAGEKTASRFVQWMFSPLGFAEWRIIDQPGEFSREELKMIKKTGVPLIPPGVSIVRDKPDPERGKQAVVKADDAKNMIVVEGYLDSKGPPVRISKWEFQ